MCFLPLGCLKAITTVGAVTAILISFALLGVTIYANVQKKQIIDRASQGFINTALVFLYIGSIVFLLLGIAGLYGSLKGGKDGKGNKCLLGIYSIGIFIFFAAFLGATIFFFVGPKAIFGTTCQNGSQTTLIKQLFDTSERVNTKFCKGGVDTCECYVKDDAFRAILADKGYNFTTINSNSPTKYQSCSIYNAAQQDKNVLLLAALQKFLQCGGWCQDEPIRFYRFTDINECSTPNCLSSLPACHKAFEDFMFGKGQTLALGCLAACIISLLNVVTACCICCHPAKSGKKKNFYARMMDTQS